MSIWYSNSDEKDAKRMTAPQEWPYHAKQARDDSAELIADASRDIMTFIRKNNVHDQSLMSALLNLQQAQTFLVSVGAQIRPERL